MSGNPIAFLLKVVELLVLFPHLELADQVIFPMLFAMFVIAVEFSVTPLNRRVASLVALLVSVYGEEAGSIGF